MCFGPFPGELGLIPEAAWRCMKQGIGAAWDACKAGSCMRCMQGLELVAVCCCCGSRGRCVRADREGGSHRFAQDFLVSPAQVHEFQSISIERSRPAVAEAKGVCLLFVASESAVVSEWL